MHARRKAAPLTPPSALRPRHQQSKMRMPELGLGRKVKHLHTVVAHLQRHAAMPAALHSRPAVHGGTPPAPRPAPQRGACRRAQPSGCTPRSTSSSSRSKKIARRRATSLSESCLRARPPTRNSGRRTLFLCHLSRSRLAEPRLLSSGRTGPSPRRARLQRRPTRRAPGRLSRSRPAGPCDWRPKATIDIAAERPRDRAVNSGERLCAPPP